MAFGSNVKIFALSLALGGALVGCDGGSYDPSTGRFIPAADTGRSTSAASAAQDPNARARSSDASGASAAQGSSSSSASSAGGGYAGSASASGYGSTYGSGSAAGSGSSAPSSFDTFSRTPPAPVLQADGTVLKPAIARVSPEAGGPQGGDEVLITGSGFANVQVLFGSAPARITSQSSNAITVIAPEGSAGRPVSIVVTNRDGTYTVASQAYSYLGEQG